MRLDRYFFAVLASIVLLVSVVSAGIALSAERTEDDFETSILVHDRGVDTEFLLDDPGYRVVEEYDAYLLVETTEDGLEALEERDYIVEELENRDYVGLQSYSFHTEEGEPEIPKDLEIEEYSDDETGYYIVQFIGPIKMEWKEELEEEGAELHEFRHRYNFIAEMDLEDKERVENKDFVDWVGVYQPAYRFDRDLLERSGEQLIKVSFFDGIDLGELAVQIDSLGGDIQVVGRNRITTEVSAQEIRRIANLDGVNSITEGPKEPKLYNDEATWVTQTNEQGNRKVTQQGVTGTGQLVTVCDSELYTTNGGHEMWEDPNGSDFGDNHRKVQDYYSIGGDLNDGVYHGSHVTGTVLGDAPTYDSYNNYDGNAIGARLIHQDIGTASGGLSVPSDMYNEAWLPSYNSGSRAHTNSWGGGIQSYTGLAVQGDEFIWDHKDYNILFAMGNDGPGAETMSGEPEGKNFFSVGGVTNSPDQNTMYYSSSRGYADDGRIKPTVLHVAQYVDSADRSADGYSSLTGTSMATPGVAGQIGQVREYYEAGWYPSGTPNEGDGFNPSNALVKGTIVNGAVEISGSGAYNNDNRFPNNDQGFGRSKLDRSLYFDGDSREMIAFDSWNEGVELGTGDTWNMNFEVLDQNQDVEVSLVWSDFPGSDGSDETDPAIVNDLDLEVTAPDGTRYVGNAFTGYDPGYSESDPTSNPWDGGRGNEYDGLNVVEDVLLLPNQNGVQKGTYEVTVTGNNVPESTQPFALVVSGAVTEEIPGTPPEIDITRPDGGEVFDGKTDEEITWDTVVGDDPIDEIQLWYSTDAGSSWTTIETGLNDTGSYLWTVPNVNSSDCIVRARATDTAGRMNEDTSQATFTIKGVPPGEPEYLNVEHYGTNQSWEWLYNAQHRSTPADGRGLTGEGTFYGAMRKEIQGDEITDLAYYAYDQANSVKGYVFEDGSNGENPGELLGETARLDNPGTQQWLELEFTKPVSVEKGNFYWVVLEVSDPSDQTRPFGSFEGIVEDNAWISLDGSQWDRMHEEYGLEYNWALEAMVREYDETGDTHNKISWGPSPDDPGEASHYNVYRSENPSGPWDESTLIKNVTARGASNYEIMDMDKGEVDDIYWWYVVRAVGENGVEDDNQNNVQEPGGIPVPLTPTNPEPADGAAGVSTDIELSVYVEHENGTAMDVEFYDASNDSLIGTDNAVPSGERAKVMWSNLDDLTTYEWYAVAIDQNDMAAESPAWSFKTTFQPENGAYELMGYFLESHDGEAKFYDGEEYYGNVSAIEFENPTNGAINEGTAGSGSWQDPYGGFAWDAEGGEDGWSDSVPEFGNNVYFVNEVPQEDVAGDAGYVWSAQREVDGDIVASPQESIIGQYEPLPTPVESSTGDDWIEIEVESPAYTDWDNDAEVSPGMGTYDEFVSYSVFVSGGEYEEWTHLGDTETVPEDEYDGEYDDPIEPWNESVDPSTVTTGMNTFEATGLDPGEYQFKVRMNIGDGLSGGYAGGYDNAYTTWTSGAPSETMVIEGTQYMLDVQMEGQGTVEVNGEAVETPYSEEYWEGTEVELTAIPDGDWYFDEWTGDHVAEEQTTTVTMDADKAVTANFVESDPSLEYELTVDVDGQGTVEVDGSEVELPYNEVYTANTEVVLNAVPDEGWVFEEWTGDYTSGEEEITVTMDDNKSLTANFNESDSQNENELT
ncbi:MAG: S8 family serine peptidase, partial [Candidatus Thermoplasmatota archaeon]